MGLDLSFAACWMRLAGTNMEVQSAGFFLLCGLDVDAVDTREDTEPLTPLFFAIKRNDPKMLRFMIDHGADLNKRAGVANADGERLKPLGYAYNLAFDDTRIDRNKVIGILDSALTEQSATGGLKETCPKNEQAS